MSDALRLDAAGLGSRRRLAPDDFGSPDSRGWLSPYGAYGDDCVCPYTQPCAVVGDYIQGFDVVVCLAGHDGVDAAGVVADHAADGAAVMAGGIGREGQMIFFGGVSEMIEDDSGLHARDAPLGIDLEDISHVLREIENDGDVAALSGERGAAAAAKERSTEVATNGDGRENIVGIARKNNADRNLAVVGAVGRVERAAAVVEADVPAHAGRRASASPGRRLLNSVGTGSATLF